MSTGENLFRTAAFGGFQKQDVLNYIESSAKEHREKLEALQGEVEQLRQGREELEKRAQEQEERLSALTAERERLEGALAQREEELRQARADAEEKGARLSELEKQTAEQQEKLRRAEPAAQAYETLKDRTAGVELEAHRRAQVIENEAQAKAKETLQKLEQWLGKVRAGYDLLRTDLDATIAHAAGELERVGKSLDGFPAEFDERDAELEQLVEECRALSGPKPPQPLPLDGEE